MKRSPMKRRVSPRTVAYNDELAELRPLIEARSGGFCEVKADRCNGRPLTLHHKLRRGLGGLNTLGNVIAACPRCHSFIHDHPMWAYEKGLLIRRNA